MSAVKGHAGGHAKAGSIAVSVRNVSNEVSDDVPNPMMRTPDHCLANHPLRSLLRSSAARLHALLAGLAFVAMASSLPAHAETAAIEDGRPCFEDICVGDDLHDLRPLDWQPVMDPNNGKPVAQSQVSDGYVQNLMKVLRGDTAAIKALAPYWFLKQVDGEGLKQLDKVVAVCQPLGVSGRLRAQYISQNGLRTSVSFDAVPSADGRSQNFVVATMTRFFNAGMGPDQIKQLGQDISRRYAGIGTYPGTDKPGVRWLPFANEGPTLKLFAPIGDVFRRGAEMRRHPACSN
ncbi:hypothetical protein BH09PSE5_BH09PSE5_01990 [soil metagenome]